MRNAKLGNHLKIRWNHFITNDEVLDRAKSTALEIILTRNRLRWMGHCCTMPDERPVKALLYGVLVLLLKDILKRGVALGTWREIITGRLARRRLASDICDKIEQEYREESQA